MKAVTFILPQLVAVATAQVTYTTVLQTGEGIPAAGGTVSSFSLPPRITADGQLAVMAALNYSGSQKPAILQGRAGAWRQMLRRDQPAPGVSGKIINLLGNGLLVQSDEGKIMTAGYVAVSDGATESGALWAENATGVQLVGVEGSPTSTGSGMTWTDEVADDDDKRFSNNGRVGLLTSVFQSTTIGGDPAGNYFSAWEGTPTTLNMVGRRRQPPPGINNSYSTIGDFWNLGWGLFDDPFLTSTGQLAYYGQVWTNANQTYQGEGLWDYLTPASRLLYYGPQPNGSLPGGGTPYAIRLFGAAGNGNLLVQQSVRRTTPATNYGALFVHKEGGGGLTYALGGGPVPGLSDAEINPTDRAVLSSSGLLAAMAAAPSTNQPHPTISGVIFDGYALVVGKDNTFAPVVINNTQAPGLPAGVNFKYNSDANVTSDDEFRPAMTPLGRLLFVTQLQGTGVTSANRKALWVKQPEGAPQLILRTGQAIAASGNRIVGNFTVVTGSSGDDGLPRGHNDAGQVAVWVDFTTGQDAMMILEAGPTIPLPPLTLPTLNITRGPGAGQVTLSWTTALTGLTIESSTTLQNGSWSSAGSPVQSGQNYSLTVPAPAGSARFFRVRQP